MPVTVVTRKGETLEYPTGEKIGQNEQAVFIQGRDAQEHWVTLAIFPLDSVDRVETETPKRGVPPQRT